MVRKYHLLVKNLQEVQREKYLSRADNYNRQQITCGDTYRWEISRNQIILHFRWNQHKSFVQSVMDKRDSIHIYQYIQLVIEKL